MNPSTKHHDKPGGAEMSTSAPASEPGRERNPSLQPAIQSGRDPGAPPQQERVQTESTAELASSLSSNMKESAGAVSRAVKEQASEVAGNIGQELSKTAAEQKTRGAEAIQGFARAMTSAATELENQSPQVAEYVRDAAQKVSAFSEQIGQRDVTELVRSATQLARSQPLLFVGGAVAAGFAVSRFFMSSAKALPHQRPPGTDAHI